MTPPIYEEPYQDVNNPLRMDRHVGLCHMCRDTRLITYCGFCEHWLCRECRNKWYERGVEAVMTAINAVLILIWKNHEYGPCCGPDGEES